jgi:PadR family transcriptional regulator, regulatory protein PadR
MNTSINQLRKKVLEICALQIISRGEVYASDMLDELREAQLIHADGTLYPLLYRLRQASLVQVRTATTEDGPCRKYYSLTAKGLEALTQLKETWEALLSTVQSITTKTTES